MRRVKAKYAETRPPIIRLITSHLHMKFIEIQNRGVIARNLPRENDDSKTYRTRICKSDENQSAEGACRIIRSPSKPRPDNPTKDAADAQQRSDTIVLQLTKQFDQQTLMLEDMRNKPSRRCYRATKPSAARELWHRLKVTLIRAGTSSAVGQRGV